MVHRLERLVIRHTLRLPSPAGSVGEGAVAARQFDAALMSVGFKLSAGLLERLSGLSCFRASICSVVSASVTPPRARPAMETPSLAATTGRGCGPFSRSVRSHSGGFAWSSFSSARETTPSWNSAGVAGRCTPSFFAAVAGFIVWVFWCDVMVSRVSVSYTHLTLPTN